MILAVLPANKSPNHETRLVALLHSVDCLVLLVDHWSIPSYTAMTIGQHVSRFLLRRKKNRDTVDIVLFTQVTRPPPTSSRPRFSLSSKFMSRTARACPNTALVPFHLGRAEKRRKPSKVNATRIRSMFRSGVNVSQFLWLEQQLREFAAR